MKKLFAFCGRLLRRNCDPNHKIYDICISSGPKISIITSLENNTNYNWWQGISTDILQQPGFIVSAFASLSFFRGNYKCGNKFGPEYFLKNVKFRSIRIRYTDLAYIRYAVKLTDTNFKYICAYVLILIFFTHNITYIILYTKFFFHY